MKNAVAFAIATFFLTLLAAPALADWKADLDSAIASQNADQLGVVIATYPDAQKDISFALLTQAQTGIATSPSFAAQMYKTAFPYMSEASASDSKTIIGVIKSMLTVAGTEDFQQNNPSVASIIYSVSMKLAGLPNIVSEAPDLYALALADADDFLDKKPIQSAEADALEEEVLLAQTQAVNPRNNALRVGAPSAD